jgi:hypothetical protein
MSKRDAIAPDMVKEEGTVKDGVTNGEDTRKTLVSV